MGKKFRNDLVFIKSIVKYQYHEKMKRTIFHTSKQFMKDPFNQGNQLFPFLNSNVVQTYANSIIRFQKVHALCNLSNINQTLPLPSPSKQFIFLGRSNVGKSTLLNNLMQKSIAAVSKRPGKTKQLLFCQIGSNSLSDKKMIQSNIYFVDAPGYGFATGVSKSQINQWGKLITTYFKSTKLNSLNQKILCLIDITHGLKQTDALVFQLLKGLGKKFTIIFTKCDKFQYNKQSEDFKKGLQIAQLIQQKYDCMNYYIHFTSCRNMLGIDQLRKHIIFEIVSDKIV